MAAVTICSDFGAPKIKILQLLVYYKRYKSGKVKWKRSIWQNLELEGAELSSKTTPSQHTDIRQPKISPNLIYNSMSSPPTLSRGQRIRWKFQTLQSSGDHPKSRSDWGVQPWVNPYGINSSVVKGSLLLILDASTTQGILRVLEDVCVCVCVCVENPMDRGAWQVIVHGVSKSPVQLSDFTFLL